MTSKPAIAPYTPSSPSQPDNSAKLVDLLTSVEIKQQATPVQGKPPIRPKSEVLLEPMRLPADTKVSKALTTPSPALLSGNTVPSIKKTISSLAYSSASAGDSGQEGTAGSVSQTDTRTAQPGKSVPQVQPIQPEADGRPASTNAVASKRASVQLSAAVSSFVVSPAVMASSSGGVSSTSSSSSSFAGLASAGGSSAGISLTAAGISSTSAGVSSTSAGVSAGVSPSKTKYTVLYDFTAGDPTELTVHEGDVVMAAASPDPSPGWLMVELNGEKGWVPESYLKVIEEVAAVNSLTEDHREGKGV